MTRPVALGAFLFLFLTAAWPAAQQAPTPPAQTPAQPRLTFRVDTNFVEVDAVVTDSKGAFVRSLTQDDFELFEDGKKQEIGTFGLVDIPLERDDKPLFRASPVEPDVATNEKDFEGRIYVIVLDANHVPAQDSYMVKKTALEFINRYLGANDVAAVVHAQTNAADFNQEFTNSRPRLRLAVDKFVGEKLESRALAVRDQAIQNANLGRAGIDPRDAKDPNAVERAARANATIDTMERVSRQMSGLRGRRKAVIMISEGLDFNLEDNLGPTINPPAPSGDPLPRDPISSNSFNEAYHASGIVERMQSMYEAASRSNVAIYTVDPRGVASELDTLIRATGNPEAFPIDIGSVTRGVREELRRQIGTLRSFAEVTGGLALVGTNDFATGFKKIVDDNSAYYVLGYRPLQPKTDGRFHGINVRLKKPGLQVRARRGYYAPKSAAANSSAPVVDPAIELINSPMAVGGLGLRTTVVTDKGAGAKVRVQSTLEIAGSMLTTALAADAGVSGNRVNVAYVAIDQAGKVAASGRKSMDLAVKPESRKAIAEYGLRLVTEFELAPGKYQFRIGAHEPGGNGGSVFTDLDVPDFLRGSVVVAPVTLSSARAGRTPTSIDAPGLPKVLPGPPTAARVFSLEDTLAVYADVYDNDLDRPHKIDIDVTVRGDDGTQVHKVSEERDSKDADKVRGGYNFLAKVPLQDLRPGRYVLTVQARSRLGGDENRTSARDIEFTIR